MGSPCGPPGYQRTLEGHISLMRHYAEELDAQPKMIQRRDVVSRILKCADELEHTCKVIEERERGRSD